MTFAPLSAIALLSAATLGYELLLLRITALIHWHHFAALAISVAMLGFGAAGSAVAILRRPLLSRYPQSFSLAAGAFALSALVCTLVAQQVPFNAFELAWSFMAWGDLLVLYLLFFLPFFCAAVALCLAYATQGEQAFRVYRADLAGAALGALLMLASLHEMPTMAALRGVTALAFLAAGLATRRHFWFWLVLAGGSALLPPAWLRPSFSPYKDISQALAVKEARLLASRQGPLGEIAVVASPFAPQRHAPGLSPLSPAIPPEQLAIFVDGQAAGAVTHFAGDFAPLSYVAAMGSSLPYRLFERPRVLVLGAGAGAEVLQAKALGAQEVVAVEADPEMVALVEEDLAAFSGRPYRQPGVRLEIAEARGFLASTRERFDLIQLALLDGQVGTLAGLSALQENYLYTVEAFAAYLDHLRPGGLLAITRWLQLPPRDALRLTATAISALERRGEEPDKSLLLLRTLNTTTLLVKNGAFSEQEIAAARRFADQYAFDLAYFPGATAADSNRHNHLEADEFFAGIEALLGPAREDFLRTAPFDLRPTRDDRPYFAHFFSWKNLPEFWRLRRQGAVPPLEWGYPLLLLALVQALVAAAVLILLPLAIGASRHAFRSVPASTRLGVTAYFLLLGFAFMAVEIPLLARLSLLLAHPAYAATLVLAGLLIFAGLGAGYAHRLRQKNLWPFAALLVLIPAYALALPLLEGAMAWPLPLRAVLASGLIAPLGFFLGMPFPLALAWLAERAPALTPWAWGINGFASVIAALAATLLAIHFGHAAVLGLAVLAYFIAWLVLAWLRSS